jgi:zinc D-Ala-D-Ala carboxypeptidase
MTRTLTTKLLLIAAILVSMLAALGAAILTTPASAAADGPGQPAFRTTATTTAAVTLAWPTLRSGARNHPVKTLQRLLNYRGASPKLAIDGQFGANTDREVRDFQRSHALTVDGIVGTNTWKKLITLLVQGSNGEQVRAFAEEKCFRNLRDTTCVIDVFYGTEDVAWTKGFQQGTGHLVVDGKVGPATWQALVAGELAG